MASYLTPNKVLLVSRQDFRTRGCWFDSPIQQIFFLKLDDGHCTRFHSSLTAAHCFDNGYRVQIIHSYLQVQNGQGRVIFLTWSSRRTSDNQKSDFTKYSIFLLNCESGELQIFTRPNQIFTDKKCDNVTQQYVINFIFQDTF